MIMTLKSAAEAVTVHNFPAFKMLRRFCFTISRCGNKNKKSIEESFSKYLQETFQIHEKGTNILDILNTMISPSEEASWANAVRPVLQKQEKKKINSKHWHIGINK